jgi:thioredoxin reductase
VALLRQIEVEIANGKSTPQACKEAEITVTLTYRQSTFSRIKERNNQRIQEFTRKGKLKVLFNSNPVEFRQDSVLMEVDGKQQAIPNDFVWIFAGGEPPTAFLKKIGVGFANRDISTEGSKEAKEARQGVLTPA